MSEPEASIRLGNRIRQRRKAAGLTQKELAVAIHCDPSYVSQIEMGRIFNPKYPILRGIATTLQTDLDDRLRSAGYLPAESNVDPLLADPEIAWQFGRISHLPRESRERIIRIVREIINGEEGHSRE